MLARTVASAGLRTKLTAATAIGLVAAVLTAALAVLGADDVRAVTDQRAATTRTLAELHLIDRVVSDLETKAYAALATDAVEALELSERARGDAAAITEAWVRIDRLGADVNGDVDAARPGTLAVADGVGALARRAAEDRSAAAEELAAVTERIGSTRRLLTAGQDHLAHTVGALDDHAAALRERSVARLAAALVGALVTAGVLHHRIATSLMRSVRRTLRVLDRAVQGDLTARVEAATSDELGRIGDTLDRMLDGAAGRVAPAADGTVPAATDARRLQREFEAARRVDAPATGQGSTPSLVAA